MFYLTAFTFFPIFLLATVPLGLGLSALIFRRALSAENDRRERGEDVSADIMMTLAPLLGLSALITVLGLTIRAGLSPTGLVPLVVGANGAVVVVLGFTGRRLVGSWRRLLLPLLVAFFAYLVLMSPLLLDGQFEVLGYNTNNDPVFHAIIPEYIEANGYEFPAEFKSGFTQAAIDKLSQQGYPDGWHQTLLLARRIYGLRAYHLFNMALAFFASMVALVGYAWARQAGLDRRWSAAGAAVSAVGYLQLSYVFQGFAPQVAVTPFLYAALLALYKAVIERQRAYLWPAAFFVQAGLAVYSFTILLWLGSYLVALGVVRVVTRELKGLGADAATALGAVALGSILNPFVLARLYTSLRAVLRFSDSDGLGNLVSAAVPILPALYIWPVGDHRLLPVGSLNRWSYIPAAVVFALLLVGLLSRSRRRFWLTAALSMVVPMVAVKLVAGPYYFAKTLQMAAPLVGLAVVAGIYRMSSSRWRHPVFFVAGILLMGAAISNAALVQVIARTPTDRFAELLDINERFGLNSVEDRAMSRSRETALFLSRGEDWGSYLLAGFVTAAPLARTYQGGGPGIRGATDVYEAIKVANDIDDFYGVLSTRFDWLIIDRAHDVSLPPPPFEVTYSGRFYTVYKRTGPASAAIRHLPAEDAANPDSLPYLEVAPGRTVQLPVGVSFKSLQVSAYLFPHVVIEPKAWQTKSTAWQYGEENGRQVLNLGNRPGHAVSVFQLFNAGSLDVFVSGDLGNRLAVTVNGQTLDSPADPFQPVSGSGPAWWRFSPVAATAGEGRLELTADKEGGGSYVGKVLLADLASKPGDSVVFSTANRSATMRVGRLPAVYSIPLRGDSTAFIRVKNISAYPLRLDWIEPRREPHDQEALFRYNRNNKLVFQSIERLVSR